MAQSFQKSDRINKDQFAAFEYLPTPILWSASRGQPKDRQKEL